MNTICGFIPGETRFLPEINATMRRYTYAQTGTELVWLDRNDENMTFAVTFKTIPEDNTGVFHIIEHSVLSGSEKYPLKEPFVELLKGSLQTFLNALTFPDKTMYPLSSRNEQDFLNLISVYMDAVLHPLSIKDPHAFLQEGWHYELESPDAELKYNGVVFNEMKGAYSSPDSVMDDYLNAAIFPDNCYRFSSGGKPECIPDLSYEAYCRCHSRFYHPSNAKIFLDGSLPLEKVLSLLDCFLSPYSELDVDADIPEQLPVIPENYSGEYEISPEEDPEDKIIAGLGYLGCRYDEQEKILAYGLVEDLLAGTNESPLVKAILDEGLAEDVTVGTQTGTLQCMPTIIVRNTSEEKLDRVFDVIENTLRDCCEAGLDHTQLEAAINRLEFTTREKDFGSYPKGIIFAMSAMDSWLYGGDPALGFCYDETFTKLRKGLKTGFFEDLLRETYLENTHRTKVILRPSATLGTEKRDREASELAVRKAKMSAGEIEALIEAFKAFRIKQNTPDSKEALASLPKLSLEHIPAEKKYIEQEALTLNGTPVFHNFLDTDGITYLQLYFKIDDLPLEAMCAVSDLAGFISHLETDSHNVLEIRTLLGMNLGSFDTAVSAIVDEDARCTPYFKVEISLLDSSKPMAASILNELLTRTQFKDKKYIFNLLRQTKLSRIEAASNSGSSFGIRHALASISPQGAVSEMFSGISHIRHLQALERDFEVSGEKYCEELQRLAERIFIRERVTVGYSGILDIDFITGILAALPSKPAMLGERVTYVPLPTQNTGYVIPSNIGFATSATSAAVDNRSLGHLLVASQFLTYDYLWNHVRVQGGAYGCSQRASVDGSLLLSSYRDPSPVNSYQVFEGCGAALRALANSDDTIDNFIISAISDTEPYLSTRLQGVNEISCALSGRTKDARRSTREALLSTTKSDLFRIADILEAAETSSVRCIIGSKETVDACAGLLDTIEVLEQ